MSCTDSYVLRFPARKVQRTFLACIAVAFCRRSSSRFFLSIINTESQCSPTVNGQQVPIDCNIDP